MMTSVINILRLLWPVILTATSIKKKILKNKLRHAASWVTQLWAIIASLMTQAVQKISKANYGHRQKNEQLTLIARRCRKVFQWVWKYAKIRISSISLSLLDAIFQTAWSNEYSWLFMQSGRRGQIKRVDGRRRTSTRVDGRRRA